MSSFAPLTCPRSILHALAPIGLATPGVESLASYFCRLANSHACTTNDLAKFIIDKIEPGRWETHQGIQGKSRFLWHERTISGLSDGALSWASMLAELTGVDTLQHLTLLPLQGCIAPKGLMAPQTRWCSQCLAQDRQMGHQPYFRLAWDISANQVCIQHNTQLVTQCPHCHASNVRNRANFVVPGWCTACGHFLGDNAAPKTLGHHADDAEACSEAEMARATAISELLTLTSSSRSTKFVPDIELLHQALEYIIEKLDGGVTAHFARRLGLRKSTVHYWRATHTPLTLDALTRVALRCNTSLSHLLQGKLDRWCPPVRSQLQIPLQLMGPKPSKHRKRRDHDWPGIRHILRQELLKPYPRSVTEIARSLDIDVRLLYIQATLEARQLGKHYVRHLHERSIHSQVTLHEELRWACMNLRNSGEGITVQKVKRQVGIRTLNSTQHLYTILTRLTDQAANDNNA